jgi:hypothetical protein
MKQFQHLNQGWLRLNRDDSRFQPDERGDAIADMRANVKNKIAFMDEFAIEVIHGGGVRAVAVVDAQRPENAARGL